jgi:hypothetical protein
MKYFGSRATSSARRTAPRMLAPTGVTMSWAPSPLSSCRRSIDIDSGMSSVSG